MTFDPAWDMPFQNWQQQGSFETPEVPPDVDPDAGTQVCVGPFAAEWLPYIQGALDQLRNPSSWSVGDDAAMYATLARVTRLKEIFGSYGACMTCPQIRLQDCVLQSSCDGGETWTDVAGWDGICTCVTDCVYPIGVPPVPPGGPSGDQLSCNIAAYLSIQILQTSFSKAVANVGLDNTLFALATEIAATLVGVGFVWTAAFVEAAAIIYEAVTAIHLSDFEDALSDSALWLHIQCCIYNAIRADGRVTEGNFNAILTCLADLHYAHSDVVSAIHDYVQSIGWRGLAELSQPAGTASNADCSTCSADWCKKFDFTANNGGWTVYNNGHADYGVYTAGVGWKSATVGTTQILQIQVNFGGTWTISSVDVWYSRSAGVGRHGNSAVSWGGTVYGDLEDGAATFISSIPVGAGLGGVIVDGEIYPVVGGAEFTVTQIEIRGMGTSPFGISDCTP